MTNPKNLIDDITQLAGGAAGLLGNAKQQISDDVKARVEEVAERMDLVPRADLEKVEDLLKKTRDEQQDILENIMTRLEKLESK